MRRNLATAILGIALFGYGLFSTITEGLGGGLIPMIIGAALTYMAFTSGRTPLLVFGHLLVVLGCMLVTMGLYTLPQSGPTFGDIFGRPLFWGLISIFGGICTIYHGFCNCIRSRTRQTDGAG
jgi:hypothetical protein